MNHPVSWIIVLGTLFYKGQWVTVKHFVSFPFYKEAFHF